MKLASEILEVLNKKDLIFLACSGGLDSMVLLCLLHEMKYPIQVRHANFQLRGPESDHDEDFVRSFCAERNIPFQSKKFDCRVQMKNADQSIQKIARDLRYAWFEEILDQHPNAIFCTAHHQDDQREQVLIRLLSSGKILDLVGIPTQRDRFIRPLMGFDKSEILKYAEKNEIPWREDSSNAKSAYTRNKIRNELMPLIEKIDPRINTALDNLSQEVQNLRKEINRTLLAEIGESLKSGVFFVPSEYWDAQLSLGKEIIVEYWSGSGSDLKEVERFTKQARIGAKHNIRNKHYLIKEKNGLWFGNEEKDSFEPIKIDLFNPSNTAYFELSEVSQSQVPAFKINESDALILKLVPPGEALTLQNGSSKKVKKIFNEEAWLHHHRFFSKGLYINNLLVFLLSPNHKNELYFDVLGLGKFYKVIIFPNLFVSKN